MHYGRITAILGSVIAVVGLGLISAASTAEHLLRALRSINPDFPASFERVLVALWNENAPAAVIFVGAVVAVVAISLTPNLKVALSRKMASIVTLLGVVMAAIGVVATLGAMDNVVALEAGFVRVAAIGMIHEGHTATVGMGWYLLVVSGILVMIGGALQIIARPSTEAASE